MATSKIVGPYKPAAIARFLIRLEDFLNAVDESVPSESGQLTDHLPRVKSDLQKAQRDLATARKAAVGNGAMSGDIPSAHQAVDRLKRKVVAMTEAGPKPAPYSRGAGDIYSVELVSVPLTAGLELNSYRMPDTLEATFAFKDLPLPDQILRSVLIELFSGEVDANDFGTPQSWALPQQRSNLMFRGYVDEWSVDHSDTDSKVSIKARSLECILYDAKINPLARVYQVQDAKGKALVEEPIDEYVNRILRQFPASSGANGGDALRAVMYKAAYAPKLSRSALIRTLQTAKSTNAANGALPGQPGPIQGATDGGGTAPGHTPGVGTPQMPQAIPGEMSVWDLIVQACRLAGVKPVYDPSIDPQLQVGIAQALNTPLSLVGAGAAASAIAANAAQGLPQAGDCILLMPLAVITETKTGDVSINGGAPDQFSRDFVIHGAPPQTSDIRIFVWGRNVNTAKTRRKLGRIKAPAVQVRSYNPDGPPGKRTLIAQYPTKKMINALRAKGDNKINEVEIRQIDSIRDPKLLQQTAVSLYHEMGRQELTVTLETNELASYYDPTLPNNERNPDVLRLRPATPVKIMVAKDVTDPARGITPTPLQDLYTTAPTELRALLLDQGRRFKPQLADDQLQKVVQDYLNAIATALTSARMTDVFYTDTVRHNWSFEDGEGWSAEIIVKNYVEARSLPVNISKQDDAINNELNPANTVTADNHQKAVDAQAQSRIDDLKLLG